MVSPLDLGLRAEGRCRSLHVMLWGRSSGLRSTESAMEMACTRRWRTRQARRSSARALNLEFSMILLGRISFVGTNSWVPARWLRCRELCRPCLRRGGLIAVPALGLLFVGLRHVGARHELFQGDVDNYLKLLKTLSGLCKMILISSRARVTLKNC